MKINVNYPNMESKVLRTVEQLKAAGYRGKSAEKDQMSHTPVNRETRITVRTTARAIQETFMNSDDYSVEQTGVKNSVYQVRHKRSFNE